MKYEQRERQRIQFFNVGRLTIILGFLLLPITLLLMVFNIRFTLSRYLFYIGQFLIPVGGTLMIVFSSMGWHKSIVLDFFLNQLSLVITMIGFITGFLSVIFFDNDKYFDLSLFITVLGILLALIGMRFHSPVSLQEDIQDD